MAIQSQEIASIIKQQIEQFGDRKPACKFDGVRKAQRESTTEDR